MKNTSTVGLPPRVKSTIASYYLGQHYQSMHSCSKHSQAAHWWLQRCFNPSVHRLYDNFVQFGSYYDVYFILHWAKKEQSENIVLQSAVLQCTKEQFSSARMKVLQEFMNKSLNKLQDITLLHSDDNTLIWCKCCELVFFL